MDKGYVSIVSDITGTLEELQQDFKHLEAVRYAAGKQLEKAQKKKVKKSFRKWLTFGQ